MSKIILGNLNKELLFISMLIAVMIFVLSYVIAHNMSSPDTKVLNMINSTSGGKMNEANPTAQNTQTLSAIEESENLGRTESVSNKCLGSALCPD